MFQEQQNDPNKVISHVEFMVAEVKAASHAFSPYMGHRYSMKDVGWSPPGQGWVKWNVDGSLVQSFASCGGCLRNEFGWVVSPKAESV